MSNAESPEPGDITLLLQRWHEGSAAAREAVFAGLYGQLRGMARRQLAGERAGHTLQPTALVHEALLRLIGMQQPHWQNRQQVLALMAQAMRRVLVDHARRRLAGKRPDPALRADLDAAAGIGVPPAQDVLSLDAVLDQLAALDARQARIVELRYFAGLSAEDVAAALELSLSTVKRDWRIARAWLRVTLGEAPALPT